MDTQKKALTKFNLKHILLLLIAIFTVILIFVVFSLITNEEKPLPSSKTKAADITYKKVIDLSARDSENKNVVINSSEEANIIEPTASEQDDIITPTSIDVRTTPKTTGFQELSPTIPESISPTNVLLADAGNTSPSATIYYTPTVAMVRTITPELPAAGSIHVPLVIFIAATMLVFFSFIL